MIQFPLEVDGITTRVLAAGPGGHEHRRDAGGGGHMVLVHGVGARADRWQHNIDPLASAGWNVWAFDLPGHGLAQKGEQPDYSVPGFARVLERFLDWISAEEAVLVGTSLGGHVAGWLTCDKPQRVRALVLVGSIGLVAWGEQRRAQTRGRLRDTSPEGIERKLRLLVYDQELVTPQWLTEEYLVNNSPGAAESFRRMSDYVADHIDDHLVGPRLASLPDRPPVLLVWGEQERAVPLQTGLEAHKMIDGSELVVIPQASHAPYMERPAEFNAALLSFLKHSIDTKEVA